MIFELVTGDYLFEPKKGKTFRKNDDHLALITELIGKCNDFNILQRHSKVWKFYDKKKKTPHLKNIKKLKIWPLYNILLEKYRLKDSESRAFADFLGCMLKWNLKDRMSARDLLNHPWLKMADDYNVWMSKSHLKDFKLVNHKDFPEYLQKINKEKEKARLEKEGKEYVSEKSEEK